MAREPFLINPPKRRKKRKTSILENYWKGNSSGHKIASGKGWKKRKKAARGYARPKGAVYPRYAENPFGEEVILVGANPKRKRKSAKSKTRKRSYRRNPVVNAAPKRRSRRRRSYKNPVSKRRSRRSYRKNPVALSLNRPMSFVMPIIAGIAGKIAVEKIPGMLKIEDKTSTYLVQAGVVIMPQLFKKQLSSGMKEAADVFTLVAGVTLVSKLLATYVPALAGLEEDEEEIILVPNDGMSAFPEEVRGMSAFPEAAPEYVEEVLEY